MPTATKAEWATVAKLFNDILTARKVTLAVACREMIGARNYNVLYYANVRRWTIRGDTPPEKDRARFDRWCEEYAPFLQLTRKK